MDRDTNQLPARRSLNVLPDKAAASPGAISPSPVVAGSTPVGPLPPPADANWPVSFPADAPSSAPDMSDIHDDGSGGAAHANRARRTDLSAGQAVLEEKIVQVLRSIFDPEIPVNIYDLGLIYEIDVASDNSVRVLMTLTAPGCPVAGTLPPEVESRIEHIPEVTRARVELVWEPTWNRNMLSEVARLELGM